MVGDEVATVHQIFSGPVAGDALLILNYDGALLLADLLCAHQNDTSRLDPSGQEALTEVGNILLNACLGMFGNLLKVHVSFSVPRLHLEKLDELLSSIMIGSEELRYVLSFQQRFTSKRVPFPDTLCLFWAFPLSTG